ncbi:MAG: DoxX family protein [Planctomycetes bacterium]|nr:DoxX family protein [Planctomycetota bacterium]
MTKQQLAIVSHVCALGVAGVFLYASLEKIWEPRQFAMDVTNFRILPDAYANLVAIILPWWELAAAIALLIPATRRAGAWVISGMLVMFIGAVAYAALYKGLHISCGCFGKDGSTAAGWKTIGLDAFLLVVTFLSVRLMPEASERQPVETFPAAAASQGA